MNTYKIISIGRTEIKYRSQAISEWTRFTQVGFKPGFFPLGRVGFYFLNTRVPGFRIVGLKCLKIRVLGNIFV